MLISLIFCVTLFGAGPAVADNSLKKIVITKTNNEASHLLRNDFVIKKLPLEYLLELRKFITEHGFRVEHKNDFDDMKQSLVWVNAQWKHDGMNQPPVGFRAIEILKSVYQEKKQYRCVEYGVVLSEVLQSIGLMTRTVALRSPDVAYGGFGRGHVAMEVWSNDLKKWIFLDPQFGIYLTKKGKELPLSYYEIFVEKKNQRWNQIVIHSAKGELNSKETNDYKDFLKNYFGHMTVSSGIDQPKISLQLESKDFPITFQGLPSNDVIFTDDPAVLYPVLNMVSIRLSFDQEGGPNFPELISSLKINTEKDYLEKMGHFAAVPNFDITLTTNTDFLKGYEYRFALNDKWQVLSGNQLKWTAKAGTNFFEVRSLNELDRKGPSIFIELKYD